MRPLENYLLWTILTSVLDLVTTSSLNNEIITETFLHLRPSYELISFGSIHLFSLACPKYYQTRTASRAGDHREGRMDPQLLGKVRTREQHSNEANCINKPHDGTGAVKYFWLQPCYDCSIQEKVVQKAMNLLSLIQSSIFSVTVEALSVKLIWVQLSRDSHKYLEKYVLVNVAPLWFMKCKVAGESKHITC